MPFYVTINGLSDKLCTISVEPSWRVRDLRRAIEEKLGRKDKEYFALFLGTNELLDDMSLEVLQEGAEISMLREKIRSSIADGRYILFERVGAGCFASVSRGREVETGRQVAVKVEPTTTVVPQLEREAEILKHITGKSIPQGFCENLYLGETAARQCCLVMDLLGSSLEHLSNHHDGKFDVKTVVLVAEQMVCRMEYLHSRGIIHRDLKPENFVFGRERKRFHLYLIDFGLSKTYWDSIKKAHMPQKKGLSLTGTARYASINAHKGIEQSRRDDLEAIGHVLLQLLRGSLPWSGLSAKTQQEKYQKIMMKKEEVPLKYLCEGFPNEFLLYVQYCRGLGFAERPDYSLLRALFQRVRRHKGPWTNHEFQWASKDDIKTDFEPLILNPRVSQPDDPELEKKKEESEKRQAEKNKEEKKHAPGGMTGIFRASVKLAKKATKGVTNIGNAFSTSSSSAHPGSCSAHAEHAGDSFFGIRTSISKAFFGSGKKPTNQTMKQPIPENRVMETMEAMERLLESVDKTKTGREAPDSDFGSEEGGEEEELEVDECVEPSEDEAGKTRIKSEEKRGADLPNSNIGDSDLDSSTGFFEDEEGAEEEVPKVVDKCVEPSDEEEEPTTLNKDWKDKYHRQHREIKIETWTGINIRPIRQSFSLIGPAKPSERIIFEV